MIEITLLHIAYYYDQRFSMHISHDEVRNSTCLQLTQLQGPNCGIFTVITNRVIHHSTGGQGWLSSFHQDVLQERNGLTCYSHNNMQKTGARPKGKLRCEDLAVARRSRCEDVSGGRGDPFSDVRILQRDGCLGVKTLPAWWMSRCQVVCGICFMPNILKA